MVKKPSDEDNKKIEELQLAEQNIQNLLVQKQVFQLETIEAKNALEELKKSKGDVFKIMGNLMIKAQKEELEKDLTKKKDIMELKTKSIEKQEKELREQIGKTRTELLKKLK